MPNRPLLPAVAVAGATAIGAALIGLAALPQTSHPATQTREVTLISGDADIYLPGPIFGGDAAASVAQPDGYDFADLLHSIANTTTAGEGWFSNAEIAFADGQYPLALSEELAGFNNLTVGVASDLLTNGYSALTGSDGNAGFELINPGQPADIATALSIADTYLTQAQMDFTQALSEFAGGSEYWGLVDVSSIGIDTTGATDAIILGLFDALTGATITA